MMIWTLNRKGDNMTEQKELKTELIHTRIAPAYKKKLEARARLKKITPANLVRNVLETYLDKKTVEM